MVTVREFFALGGPLHQKVGDGYEVREPQVRMAEAVYDSVKKDIPLAVQAPTGVGKSFAYVVGAALAGARVIVTTANKALQQQLIQKDLPLLREILTSLGIGDPVFPEKPWSYRLVVGKSNYVCDVRVAQPDVQLDGAFREWATARQDDGSYANSGMFLDLPLAVPWQQIAETAVDDTCMRFKCSMVTGCRYIKAKLDAQQASVLVGNQHMLAIDLNIGWRGVMVPNAWMSADVPLVVIVDEAHQWAGILSDQTSTDVTMGRFNRYADDPMINMEAERFIRWYAAHLRPSKGKFGDSDREASEVEIPGDAVYVSQTTGTFHLPAMLREWANAVWPAALEPETPSDMKAKSRADAARSLADDLLLVNRPAVKGTLRLVTKRESSSDWLGSIVVRRQVYDVSDIARLMVVSSARPSRVLEDPDDVPMRGPYTSVFTSATLQANGSFKSFLQDTGMSGMVDELVLPPVFDYKRNAIVYLPKMGNGNMHEQAYQENFADEVLQVSKIVEGHTMILVTSYAKLRYVADWLSWNIPRDWQLLRQDQEHNIGDAFRSAGGRKSILVGTASFWEGVDFPGDILQVLGISTCPFPPFDTPIYGAKKRDIIAQSGKDDSFRLLSLPMMSLRLQQGYGRLIRRATDRGVIVMGDSRLYAAPWGRPIVNRDLPPIPTTNYLSVVRSFLVPAETASELV